MEREEAINNLKKVLGFSPTYDEAFYTLFPEFNKESEDERIGNVIYCIVRDNKEIRRILEGNGVSVDNALAYLERQKEEPSLPANLDEAAEEYSLPFRGGRDIWMSDITNAFKAGAAMIAAWRLDDIAEAIKYKNKEDHK